MDCVIYSRVSTIDQDNKRQILDLEELAEYEKLEVKKVFQEKITGTSKAKGRIEFKKMMDYIEKHDIKFILVWELSRLGRDMVDVINLIDSFSKKGITVFTKENRIRTLKPDGTKDPMMNIIINVLSGFAQFERDTIKARSKSGIRKNVADGGSGTGIIMAYGFKKEGKKLVQDEDEVEIVELIYQKFLDGLGTTRIANYLNEKKIPTKYNKVFADKAIKTRKGIIRKKGSDFRWRDRVVHSILTNSIYCGKRVHAGEIFRIEPIIDETTFNKVQNILHEKFNKKGINRKYINIFKEKIICGKCGHTYFMHKRHDNRDNAYKCLSKRYQKYCGNPSVNIDKLNNGVYYLIKDEIRLSSALTNQKTGRLTKIDNELESIELQLSALEKEKTEIDYKLSKLLDEFLKSDSKINESLFNKMNEEYNKRNDQLNRQTAGLIDDKLKLVELRKNITDFEKIDIYNVEVFKSYVNEFIDYIKVYEVNDLFHYKNIFKVKNDVGVLVELKTKLFNSQYFFMLSQKSKKMLLMDMTDMENFQHLNSLGYIQYETRDIGSNIKINEI